MVAAAIAGAAVLGAGASIYGAETQASAARSSGELQGKAAKQAADLAFAQYSQAREDSAPYREIGENALLQYGALYGVGREGLLPPAEMEAARGRFKETPGYKFRFDEGTRALDRSASSRGRLLGGGFAREITRYGQGVASAEFENYSNRINSLVGIGNDATARTSALGARSAANQGNALLAGAEGQGNALLDAATARSSGYTGLANAASGGVQNYLLYDYLRPKGPGSAPPTWESG